MSHKSRIPEGSQSFLSDDGIVKMGKKWSRLAAETEPAGKVDVWNDSEQAFVKKDNPDTKRAVNYVFTVNRTEGGKSKEMEVLHGESFTGKIIPEMLKKISHGEKLKILDNGAGTAYFTEQIRSIPEFVDKVVVYSTGISKQAARKQRRRDGKDSPLHQNDLKWRSLQELSDFPEFNLIVDSFGEQYYRTSQSNEGWDGIEVNVQEMKSHISQVISKLATPGYASIAPIFFSTDEKKEAFLQQIRDSFGVQAYFSGMGSHSLKIVKN